MNFFGIGGFELVVIVGLAFFLLGPKKMIETSRDAGKIIRELKEERDKFTRMVMEEYEDEDESAPSTRASSTTDTPGVSTPDTPEGAVSRPRGRLPQETAASRDSNGDRDGDDADDRDSRPGPGGGGPA